MSHLTIIETSMVDEDILREACDNLGIRLGNPGVLTAAGYDKRRVDMKVIDSPHHRAFVGAGFRKVEETGAYEIVGGTVLRHSEIGDANLNARELIMREYAAVAVERHARKLGHRNVVREVQADGSVLVKAIQRGVGVECHIDRNGKSTEMEAKGYADNTCLRATAGLERDLGGGGERVMKRRPDEPIESVRARLSTGIGQG